MLLNKRPVDRNFSDIEFKFHKLKRCDTIFVSVKRITEKLRILFLNKHLKNILSHFIMVG